MLRSAVVSFRIVPATPFPRRLLMPRYEFFCTNCKKLFSMVLSPVDYQEGDILCPHCGSKDVEQCWSAFSSITSKKSA
jgi:putative FmdB family regulatory protein